MTMMSSRIALTLAAAALLVSTAISTAAIAEDGSPHVTSGNVSMVSDYVFRGVSQTAEKPTVQGGFDYEYTPWGVYAGTWGSGVDFTDASYEVDFYGGWRRSWDTLTLDLGGIYYAYPGAEDNLEYDYWEAAAALGYDFGAFSTTAAVNYSPDNFGGSGHAVYSVLYLDIPLPYSVNLNSHIGYQAVEDNATFALPDYTDWSVGLGYNLGGFDLNLSYADTDIDESDCADGCDARALFSVSRSF